MLRKIRKIKKKYYREKANSQLILMQKTALDEMHSDMRTRFLDCFAMCDATCKIFLKKYCDIRKQEGAKKIKCELSMNIIPSALTMFEFEIERNLLNRIFSAENKRGRKSAKMLRNGLVHELNNEDMEEVVERFEQLINDMNLFLSHFSDHDENI